METHNQSSNSRMPKFEEVLLKHDTIPFRINISFSIKQKNVDPCTYKQNVPASFWLWLHQVWWSDASILHTDVYFSPVSFSNYIMSAIFRVRFLHDMKKKSKLQSRTSCKQKNIHLDCILIRKMSVYPPFIQPISMHVSFRSFAPVIKRDKKRIISTISIRLFHLKLAWKELQERWRVNHAHTISSLQKLQEINSKQVARCTYKYDVKDLRWTGH